MSTKLILFEKRTFHTTKSTFRRTYAIKNLETDLNLSKSLLEIGQATFRDLIVYLLLKLKLNFEKKKNQIKI